jgi:CelD/BcsL family acetyltransferase involved in cellulose biosynthesis
MSFICQVIDSQEAFHSQREQWNELVEQSSSCTFFMSWEWLDTWLSVYGDVVGRIIIILVREQDGGLVGAVPLYLVKEGKGSGACLSGRQLRFIGSGEDEWEEVASEYLDILSLPDREDQVCGFLLKEFAGFEFNWSQLNIENVLEDAVFLRKFIPLLMESGYHFSKILSGQRYRIGLPGSWQEYEVKLGKSMRRKVRQSRKRVHEMDDNKTEAIKNIESGLSELVALHAERWKKKEEQGAFASPKFIAFHSEFMYRLLKNGGLRLRRTSIGNDLIGILYNIRFGNTESYYQSGFDLKGGSRIRPGIYAHMRAIEISIEEGVKYYDMMKGGDTSYKSEYQTELTPMFTVRLYNRSISGRLCYAQDIARQYMLKLKARIDLLQAGR